MKKIFIIPSILLLIALLHLPYGYYSLLKLVVCFVLIKEILELNQNQNNINEILIFSALAVLYNPIVAIPLGKVIWSIVNITTIIYLIYYSKKRM